MAKTKNTQSIDLGLSDQNTVAEDIMSTVLVVIDSNASFRTAVELLNQKKLTVLPVVDEQGKLLGTIGEQDVLTACSPFSDAFSHLLDSPIQYQKSDDTVGLSTSVNELGERLTRGPSRHVLVVDGTGILKGIITRRDLIRILYLRNELAKVSGLQAQRNLQ